MQEEYYPWGGDFISCNPKGCIAVVLLNIDYTPPESIAVYGFIKTENIGIEKIIANTISNPHIRFLLICGDDIRGHRPGSSLIALKKNGINEQNRIINAPGAIPYIENLSKEAIKRFRNQIKIINLIGIREKEIIDNTIIRYNINPPSKYGKPYIAIRIKPEILFDLKDKRALHSKIIIDYNGKIQRRDD